MGAWLLEEHLKNWWNSLHAKRSQVNDTYSFCTNMVAFLYVIILYADPKYVSTFLFGYRHLATPLEFAKKLHERYPLSVVSHLCVWLTAISCIS